MAVGRRGVLFTMMAFVIVAYIIASQRAIEPQLTPEQADTYAARSRVMVLDAYTQTFEEQVAQAYKVSGYFALKNISWRIGNEGNFANRINDSLWWCLAYNNLSLSNLPTTGATQRTCISNGYLPNATLKQLTDLAQQELSITTTYRINSVRLSEEEPMRILLWINVSYNVTDVFATWNRTVIVRTEINMQGVEDPVYEWLRGNTFIDNTGNRTFQLSPIPIGSFNDTNFPTFYGNRSYIAYENRSPSVLLRYEGNLTGKSECCGVESLIVRSTLTSAPKTYANYSMTDHEFTAHLSGDLPHYDCNLGQVRALSVSGGALILEKFRFENTYNQTAALADCTSP